MTDVVVHRIGLQRLELRVANEAAARDAHACLSSEFRSHVGPVLDEVFSDACPPDVTLRVGRLEIDAGTVPRDGLTAAVAAAIREQLAALLRAPEPIDPTEPSAALPRRLGEDDVALERLALFLEHGATSWRDADVTGVTLEATLLRLIDAAPGALRRLLQHAPPAPVAGRIRAQLTVAGRHRLLAWLGVADPADLDRVIGEWTAVLAALEHAPDFAAAAARSSERVAAWLFERVCTHVLAGGRIDAAGAAVGEYVLAAVMPDLSAPGAAAMLETVLVTAERVLSLDSPVLRVLAERSARIDPDARLDPGNRRPSPRDAKFGRVVGGEEPRDADADRRVSRHDAAPDDAIAAGGAICDDRVTLDDGMTRDAGAARNDGEDTGASDREGSVRAAAAASRTSPNNATERWERHGTAPGTDARPGIDGDPADAARQRLFARLQEAMRPLPSARRRHATFGTEPLWVAHAGAVIVWPFLPPLFDACGLTAAQRFVDGAARARAVLLTAHLVSGLEAWVESDLLLEKTLCGSPGDEAIAPAIELRDGERQQAEELLASVRGHWTALKSTSMDGLRRAFLCRPGTMTAIASGWKLEIPRAGHDVLLDTLPWGIGVVLLPWMEQPLHVEW